MPLLFGMKRGKLLSMDLAKFLVKKKDAEAVAIDKILKAAGDKVRRTTAAKIETANVFKRGQKAAHAR